MLKIRKKLAEKKEASKGIAKAGFTLIELLVVIAILAILVLLAAPRFLGYTKDANVATMQADSKVLANAALIYNIEEESWPVAEGEDTKVVYTVKGYGEEAEPGNVTAKPFTENALKDHVQTLKGKLTDYALVTESTVAGLQEGDVILVNDDSVGEGNVLQGIENRKEDKHYSSGLTIKKVVTPGE